MLRAMSAAAAAAVQRTEWIADATAEHRYLPYISLHLVLSAHFFEFSIFTELRSYDIVPSYKILFL